MRVKGKNLSTPELLAFYEPAPGALP